MSKARHTLLVALSVLIPSATAPAQAPQPSPGLGPLGPLTFNWLPGQTPFSPPSWWTTAHSPIPPLLGFCGTGSPGQMYSGPGDGPPGGETTPAGDGGNKPQKPGENHGGKYIPGDILGKPTVGGKVPSPPKSGGKPGKIGSGGGAGGGIGPIAGGSPAGSGGAPRASGGSAPGAAGVGGALSGKKSRSTVNLDRWDMWWDLNKEAFLIARSTAAPSLTKQRGFFDGYGRSLEVPEARRPPEAVLIEDIVPALRESLSDADASVRSAAALALGRVGTLQMSDVLIGDLRTMLADPDADVRTSAMLAIGAFGDRNATRSLWAVMNDTREGREMLASDGALLPRDRALAAFALGLSSGGDVASQCRRLLARANVLDFEITGCAILALGLVGQNDPDLVPFLGSMMTDQRLDRRVRAQVPLALARIGSASVTMLPYMLQYAKDPRTEGLLRESSVLALGRLAGTFDSEVIASLRELVRNDSDASVRHFALVGLAQIASRGAGSTAEETVRGVARFLLQQIDRPRYGVDVPWAALGAGILAGSLPVDSDVRVDLVEALNFQFKKVSNPAEEGAMAIALGLARATQASTDLRERLAKRNDDATLAHIATALGLIGDRDVVPTLEAALEDDTKPQLRIAAARALDLLGARDASDIVMTRLEGKVTVADARSLALAAARLHDPRIALRLARVVRKQGIDPQVRAACCEALGILAERTEVPFHSELTRDLNIHVGLSAPSEVIERL
jgi:HEAT repeat protein